MKTFYAIPPGRSRLPAWQLRRRQREVWRGAVIWAGLLFGCSLGWLAIIWSAHTLVRWAFS